MKSKKVTHILASTITAATLLLGSQHAAGASTDSSTDWKDQAISPVANPLFFESPLINSEIRPIFLYHNIGDDLIGGFTRVYALQVRYAVTEKLAVIATKDGYIQLRANAAGYQRREGFADIGAGLKYALIDDKENNFILTPGLKFEAPSGAKQVFQGNGNGEVDLFVSAMKGWDQFHATASVGGRVPLDFDKETSSLHYSLQLDYYTCQWFIPFAVMNGQTVLSEAKALPFKVEGFDLINFGSSNAEGFTQVAVGGGFRSRICKMADVGFAYEKGITTPKGIFDDRFTVDLIVRF